MRGYFTANGFWGLVDGRYMQFACEADYYEYAEAQSAAAKLAEGRPDASRTAA
jgi:hypothetical protein